MKVLGSGEDWAAFRTDGSSAKEEKSLQRKRAGK
jgi:hypothetical protein